LCTKFTLQNPKTQLQHVERPNTCLHEQLTIVLFLNLTFKVKTMQLGCKIEKDA